MKNFNKILIIRFSSIGDIVLATSPLKTIRKLYPNAMIHFLTLEKFSPLLELQPSIDKVIKLDSKSKWKNLLTFNKMIISAKYDKIYDLHGSIRSYLVTMGLSKIVSRVRKPRLLRFILFQFHINLFPKEFSAIYMYHKCIKGLNEKEFPETLLTVSSEEIKSAKEMLTQYGIRDRFVVAIPGAAWGRKVWSFSKYCDVIDKIKAKTDLDIVLLGTDQDKINNQISEKNKSVINFSGKTNLRQAMAILSLSESVFGSDTGLLHIAEALGKSANMILGPTSKETGGGVSLKISNNIETDIWCRPCSQNGKNLCYRSKQYCMDLISPSTVSNAVIKSS